MWGVGARKDAPPSFEADRDAVAYNAITIGPTVNMGLPMQGLQV
jgi:hypothetical protein